MARHPWKGLVTACAAVALVIGPTALGASAAPDVDVDVERATPAQKVDPQVLRALQRDLGLSPRAAAARLAFQTDAAGIERSLERRLGASYAGAWVDASKNVLHVAVADAAAATAVTTAGARPVVVDDSLAELDSYQAGLDRVGAPSTVPSWYVDVTTNQVVVAVHAGGERAAREFVARAGVPAASVTFRTSTEQPRTFIDIVGGNAYRIGTSRCSVGFSVSGGFVSAGHCGTVGARTTTPSGTFRGSSFPGNDYSWIQADAGNTPIGAVNRYDGTRANVAGSADAAIGSSVCRSGSTTGWHCGTIQARNATVTYAQGTVTGLIRTNVCAEPGDSGGSLIAGSQAQGVTSGGSGNCSSGGTTYFQPVNEILSAYGLTLTTGGGGGGTGCTGYASTYTGSLSSGQAVARPSTSGLSVTRSGTIRLCLAGPSGTDFDLYLQKRNASGTWSSVASATSASNHEAITYSGTTGTYRYVVHAYAGSGSYTLGATLP